MKRKLSLLMVVMMVLTLIPAMPSFAATKNRVDRIATVQTTDSVTTPNFVIENDNGDLTNGDRVELRLGAGAEWNLAHYSNPANQKIDGGVVRTDSLTYTGTALVDANLDFATTPLAPFVIDGQTVTLTTDYPATPAGKVSLAADIQTDLNAGAPVGISYSVTVNANNQLVITKQGPSAPLTFAIVAPVARLGLGVDSQTATVTDAVDGYLQVSRAFGDTLVLTAVGTQAQLNNAIFRVPVVVDLKNAPEGNQSFTLERGTGVFGSGSFVYATTAASSVTMRTTKAKIARGGNETVSVVLDETTANAFGTNNTFTLRLPNGFTWAQVTNITAPAGTTAVPQSDARNLLVTVGNTVNLDSAFITARLSISRDARLGDVDVVASQGSLSPSSLVIAEYVDQISVVKVDKVLDVVAGRDQEGLYKAKVIIEEPVAGSVIPNRFIEFSFDKSQASLQDDQTLRILSTNTLGLAIDADSSDALTASGYVPTSLINTYTASPKTFIDGYKWDLRTAATSTSTAGRTELEIPFVVSADFEGKLELTVKGAGIEEQKVVVADVKKPVAVEIVGGTTAELVLGLQKQSAPEIIITETEAGALEEKMYSITSTGTYNINWDDAKIEVIEGNLVLDKDSTEAVTKGINIDVDRRSTTPSKIKITGVQVTLDRTVPFGPFKVKMNFGKVADRHDRLDNNIGSQSYFNVVTPVQDSQKSTAIFKIGEANYTVNGETKTLDAPVFVSNNRTMLPIGAIAQVVGASVNYSPETRTAVFVKDGVVVSMMLDQPFLTANGVMIPMDSAPVVVQSRAFVPMAFIAQAFGVPVQYNAETKEVTVN